MEKILELARKAAEEVEVYRETSEEAPVRFEANRLKTIQAKQSESVSLRIIKNGRLGYAAASGEYDPQALVQAAVETAAFGQKAAFHFPAAGVPARVQVLDPAVEKVSIGEMIELGRQMIEPVVKTTPGIVCEAAASRSAVSVNIINSKGRQAAYRKSIFGLGVGGTLVRDTDMLFVGDGKDSCHVLRETQPLVDTVLEQLRLARNTAAVPSRSLPIIFTPDGVVSAFIPALMAAFNGKIVLQGASPLGKRLNEQVFDPRFSLYDDATIDFAAGSRPVDDEGVPSRRTTLVEEGVVRSFLYDLQTAGQAGTESTGSGGRARGGIVSPSAAAFVIGTGRCTYADMIKDIREGLVVEQLMGAEQGNVLGGDFSGNVLLGYKVENGKIVGRVKNTMLCGNVYQILKEVVAFGQDAKWVGGGVLTPHIYCKDVAVASG